MIRILIGFFIICAIIRIVISVCKWLLAAFGEILCAALCILSNIEKRYAKTGFPFLADFPYIYFPILFLQFCQSFFRGIHSQTFV